MSESSSEEEGTSIDIMMSMMSKIIGEGMIEREMPLIIASVKSIAEYALSGKSDTDDTLAAIARVEKKMDELQAIVAEQRVLIQKVHDLAFALKEEQRLK